MGKEVFTQQAPHEFIALGCLLDTWEASEG